MRAATAGRPRLPLRSMRSNTAEGTARRLGLARPAMHRLPMFGTLAYVASRVRGGKASFMEIARLCEDESIKALVWRWDSLSYYDQRRVPLEDLCEVCGVQPHKLVGEVASAGFRLGHDISTLIAAIAHPKVMKACVDRALQADGFRDREMLFKASGVLPTPAGPSINIVNSAAARFTTTGGSSEEDTLTLSEVLRRAHEKPDSSK